MQLETRNQQQAIAFGMNNKYWNIYRRLSSGRYMMVGTIKWDCNYMRIPVKEKYFKLIFLSAVDYGKMIIPE